MKLGPFAECMLTGHVFIARGQLHTIDGEPSIFAWYCQHCHAQFAAVQENVKLPRRGGLRIWFRTLFNTQPVWKARDGVRSFFYTAYDVLPLLPRRKT